jgi:phage-related holin
MDKQNCEKAGKSQPMIPRMEYLDLAKGIAVLFMIQVHLMEVFARPDVLNSRKPVCFYIAKHHLSIQ